MSSSGVTHVLTHTSPCMPTSASSSDPEPPQWMTFRSHPRAVPHHHLGYRFSPRKGLSSSEIVAQSLGCLRGKTFKSITGRNAPSTISLGSHRRTVSSTFASSFSLQGPCTISLCSQDKTDSLLPTTTAIPNFSSSFFSQKQKYLQLTQVPLSRIPPLLYRLSRPVVDISPFTCSLSSAFPPLILYPSQPLSSLPFPFALCFCNSWYIQVGSASVSCFL